MAVKKEPVKQSPSKRYEIEMTERFIAAFNRLHAMRRIKNSKRFALTYEIDPSNFRKIMKKEVGYATPYMVNILITEFGVDAYWIMTGKGDWLYK